MIDPHECVDSAIQDQYAEFAAVIRSELARRATSINDLSICDLHTYICCCRDAAQFEVNAQGFDKKVEKVKSFGD